MGPPSSQEGPFLSGVHIMQKNKLFIIADALEELILLRLKDQNILGDMENTPVDVTASVLIHKLKYQGRNTSDEWIADMAACVNKILEDEYDVVTDFDSETPVHSDESLSAPHESGSALEDIIKNRPELIEEYIWEIKVVLQESLSATTPLAMSDAHNSTEFVNRTFGKGVADVTQLLDVIEDLTLEELLTYLGWIDSFSSVISEQLEDLFIDLLEV